MHRHRQKRGGETRGEHTRNTSLTFPFSPLGGTFPISEGEIGKEEEGKPAKDVTHASDNQTRRSLVPLQSERASALDRQSPRNERSLCLRGRAKLKTGGGGAERLIEGRGSEIKWLGFLP